MADEGAKKFCLVLVANGSEEVETISIVDALRRAKINVTLAAVGENLQVKCSRGVQIVADSLFSACNCEEYDAIILPGKHEVSITRLS